MEKKLCLAGPPSMPADQHTAPIKTAKELLFAYGKGKVDKQNTQRAERKRFGGTFVDSRDRNHPKQRPRLGFVVPWRISAGGIGSRADKSHDDHVTDQRIHHASRPNEASDM